MYCWGNMRNGELGLGGLEEDIITFPRASTFHFSDEITEGNLSFTCLTSHQFTVWLCVSQSAVVTITRSWC